MLKDYFYLGNCLAVCVRANGQRVVVDTQDVGMINFLTSDVYERDVAWAIDYSLSAGDIFIDVGANCGLHAVAAGKRVGPSGRGFALEPNPRVCGVLKTNLRLNGVNNVAPLQAAAFNKAGQVEFTWEQDQHRVGAVVVKEAGELYNYGEEKVTVQALRIDDLDFDRSKLRLIKIDVEGREPFVIEGALETIRASKCTIIGEYHEQVIASVYGSVERYHKMIGELGLKPFAIDVAGNKLRPLKDYPGSHANLVMKPA